MSCSSLTPLKSIWALVWKRVASPFSAIILKPKNVMLSADGLSSYIDYILCAMLK